MARHPDAKAAYECADLFRQRCLVEGRSLLWPDSEPWTGAHVAEIEKSIERLKTKDGSGQSLEKWGKDLAAISATARQLAMDIFVLYFMFPYFERHQRVADVEGMLAKPPLLAPSDDATWKLVKAALERGVSRVRGSYQTNRPHELHFLTRFVQAAREQKLDAHNLQRTVELAEQIKGAMGTYPVSLLTLMHLLFPDEIEDIPRWDEREQIIRSFAALEEGSNSLLDLERQIVPIRARLSNAGTDSTFSFYREDIQRQWDASRQPEVGIESSERSGPNQLMIAPNSDFSVWWVNQGNNFQNESKLGYIWGGKVTKNGVAPKHRTNLLRMKVNDIVIHYAVGVRGVGIVRQESVEQPRPGSEDLELGYLVRIDYTVFSEPIGLNSLPLRLRTEKDGPFNVYGGIKQGYLYPAANELLQDLVNRFEREWPQDVLRFFIPTNINAPTSVQAVDRYIAPTFGEIVHLLTNLGLRLEERTLRRYHLALRTRGFVILSGLSGTGKTWLAKAYAEAVGARHLVVSVAPNWTTNEDLLGYASPLTERYHDTAFSRFLRNASAEHERATAAGVTATPYHVVLDEMNLARVEYYFAKFLSAMEIRVRDGRAEMELGPDDIITLTPNLFAIGTVNIDETTHGFADKVYDRAQLIELEARREDLVLHLGDALYAEAVMQVWECVRSCGPFTFRVLDEIAAYVSGASALDVHWQESLDEQILQKVLPRLKGADFAIGDALDSLVKWAEDGFPLTRARAQRMLDGYRIHGFASYFSGS